MDAREIAEPAFPADAEDGAAERQRSAAEGVGVAEVFEDVQVVTNPGPSSLQVWFEPWGMPHPLHAGATFRVVGRSPQLGRIELVETEASVAVYGWPGSTLRVYNGEILVDDFGTVFPELPPGMSTRGFVEFMFGGPGQDAEPISDGLNLSQ